eukprot:RCo034846
MSGHRGHSGKQSQPSAAPVQLERSHPHRGHAPHSGRPLFSSQELAETPRPEKRHVARPGYSQVTSDDRKSEWEDSLDRVSPARHHRKRGPPQPAAARSESPGDESPRHHRHHHHPKESFSQHVKADEGRRGKEEAVVKISDTKEKKRKRKEEPPASSHGKRRQGASSAGSSAGQASVPDDGEDSSALCAEKSSEGVIAAGAGSHRSSQAEAGPEAPRDADADEHNEPARGEARPRLQQFPQPALSKSDLPATDECSSSEDSGSEGGGLNDFLLCSVVPKHSSLLPSPLPLPLKPSAQVLNSAVAEVPPTTTTTTTTDPLPSGVPQPPRPQESRPEPNLEPDPAPVAGVNEEGVQPAVLPAPVPLTRENRRDMFMGLLRETGVHPKTPWASAMKLLVKDPRYMILKSTAEREACFEEYCKASRKTFEASGDGVAETAEERERRVDLVVGSFRALLRRLGTEGMVTAGSRWDSFLGCASQQPEFVDVCRVAGIGQAVSCFDEFVGRLQRQYQAAKREIRTVLRSVPASQLPSTPDALHRLLAQQGLPPSA